MPHIHDLIDFTATAYIVHKDKVLIRKHDKYGWWFGVGGHIELDEHPIEAIKRECLEEVGLVVTVPHDDSKPAMETPAYDGTSAVEELPPPPFMNIHRVNETHQHLDLIYFVTSESDKVVPENEDDEWLWLTAAEVEAHPDIDARTKKYALGALAELSW